MILASLVPYTLTYAVAIFMEDKEHINICAQDSIILIMASFFGRVALSYIAPVFFVR